ncbi:SulP family inorganic anion transporter [Staphylococcus muscae]|uniref:Sodium-independent anion transporter n=2 Tax=Staphylococcus muscae TaxID=1294 RepID=A0A240C7X3_9STAP|nr:SulP family inorganic anion transporter [Staphylococcus muscae]AVQ33707.1 SulP family inorganic anion transporter [Staphylococcus muscae]PNZ03630.1 SulP family inorganic anion transporter [Staphylococcus muscae]GGA87079.1 sodium-independent anion transporter [Staphylococcus muscae]SNW04045.1 sulfate permease family protein [Staphylococcus muscae]
MQAWWEDYRASWLGNYYQNILAGVLVALAMLPGAIAYSFIAGVSPTTSMISTSMMMVYISFLGARTLMVSAPSSGVSLIVVMITASYSLDMLAASIIIMGIIQIIFGYCHVSKAIKLIPVPVVIGFMNALCYLLFAAQLKHIFGYNFTTYIYAILSLLVIWLVPRWTTKIPAALLSIIVFTCLSFFTHADLKHVSDYADIHVKIPSMQLPHLDWQVDTLLQVIVFGLMLATVATIQTSLIAQMMDDLTQTPSDKDKESRGQGVSNLLIGLFGGLAGSGLVGQSKFVYFSGATSRLSMLVIGVVMGLFVFVLGPIVGQIPMVVLATVLIKIALKAFDPKTKILIVKRRYADFMIMLLTVGLTIYTKNLALGVLAGTACYYLYKGVENVWQNSRNN